MSDYKVTIKVQNNNILIVWGGPHPTFFPEKCFKMCNIIAVGEAEEALVELADKMEKKKILV